MKADEIKKELSSLFVTIQKIDAPMTENNVAVMNACLGSIKFLYNNVEEGGSADGNADVE